MGCWTQTSIAYDVKNISFILVQVKKNDVSTTESQAEILKKMDPFACGLLHESDKVDGYFPIPFIHIVFALCTNKQKPEMAEQLIWLEFEAR